MQCQKSDLLWNTQIAVVMFTFFKNVLSLVFSRSLQISGHKFKDISIYFFGYMFFWLERTDKAANFPLIVILFSHMLYPRVTSLSEEK